MKKISSFILAGLMLVAASCKESEFTERYADPAKIAESTVEKQYTGFLFASKDFILPGYGQYFVTLRTSINRYNQAVGWPNESGQYVPGSAGVQDMWFNYYNTLAQYRQLEKIYASKPAEEQTAKKIFMLTAKVYLYNYTQRMVDVHGAIPFTQAGKLSTNGGDYVGSSAKFDSAEELYTLMLDDLKSISNELNNLTLDANYVKPFQTQDFVNKGDLMAWKRFTNSLRLRMLNRVSGVANFQARSNTEIAEILNAPAVYPVVETNAQNIQINVFDINTEINGKGFQDGIASGGSWYGNTAGKKMIDHMTTNADPRLRVIFEPGANAKGAYIGIDPLGVSAAQTALFNAGSVAIYNRYTLSHNQFFPGVIINAPEVNLIKAEYYLRSGNDASAKASYETAISQSANFYRGISLVSNATQGVKPALSTDAEVAAFNAEIAAYIAANGVSWTKAATSADKLALIATQKWLHFNLVQPYENWAETRRLDLPALSFLVDNANNQTLPPVRWTYPGNEVTYNPENYASVRDNDKLTIKLFWDVK
jgi:hypothetical protein